MNMFGSSNVFLVNVMGIMPETADNHHIVGSVQGYTIIKIATTTPEFIIALTVFLLTNEAQTITADIEARTKIVRCALIGSKD